MKETSCLHQAGTGPLCHEAIINQVNHELAKLESHGHSCEFRQEETRAEEGYHGDPHLPHDWHMLLAHQHMPSVVFFHPSWQ
jgi:hypothetical protein